MKFTGRKRAFRRDIFEFPVDIPKMHLKKKEILIAETRKGKKIFPVLSIQRTRTFNEVLLQTCNVPYELALILCIFRN